MKVEEAFIEKFKKEKSRRGEDLSFFDIEKLMKHDDYKRVRGALRQIE
jgi:hypothetical protein